MSRLMVNGYWKNRMRQKLAIKAAFDQIQQIYSDVTRDLTSSPAKYQRDVRLFVLIHRLRGERFLYQLSWQ
ncbi:protein of unknown function [Xenorhabdus poinarii G6]|uniref:Uncharacterized protein n=1 Tax=Xenorhabdus poinarii G6 TaxID=1354304 RepID=A0A068R531_9GAMM|nr:protein of unknown function [Xenorhabdus poinarii G6]